MFKRTNFQNGCLVREKRKSGPDVWSFRWRQTDPDGKRVNRKVLVGTVEEFRTKSEAQKAVAAIRVDINKGTPRAVLNQMKFGQLAAHYQDKEVPEELSNAKVPKAHSTTVTYRRYLKKWILPRWESLLLQDFRSVAVEDWLHGLSLANGTKAKIRNIMSAVFRHAIRYAFLPRHDESNPMKYVRQTAESNVVFTILLEEQVWGIVGNLRQPAHTMAFLDAFTGLRISELLALKWADIDFDKLEINVSRAIVYGVVGKCKSKASKKPLPLDPAMAAALCGWRQLTPFNAADDWIFASPKTDGRMPLTPDNLRRRHLQPAAKQAGVKGKVGWHTFRRTLASLFIANGVDVKATQELLRHANSKLVLDLYAQATTSNKRAAQSKVIEMVLPKPPQVVAAMR